MDRAQGVKGNPRLEYSTGSLAAYFDRLISHDVRESGVPPITEPRFHGVLVERAISALALAPDDVLLDAGSGDGRIAIYAARRCCQVIGIDISRKGLDIAGEYCRRAGIGNALFDYGSLEEPCIRINLADYPITKILVLRSLHHLPDDLKWVSLKKLVRLLHRPGRLVIGDLMFFEPPEKHFALWDEAAYDGGFTDIPSPPDFFRDCLTELGGKVTIERVHPLMGVVTGEFI